ncbi:DUF3859 domain-containing protein, partial [Pseudoalteromonas aliena]|uniref:DUF3859 domain-containing protein n=1 Tax=Pseudoalteromonas aliena TaxID=247523 RepID=UPI00311DA6BD
NFYLGDTLWLPIVNKLGDWRMSLELNGKIIADKSFNVALDQESTETDFWKTRGY